MKSYKNIAFIPARGGSKRFPRKNLAMLNGKPLLAYAIEAAQKSEVFDAIVVSSDDEAILSAAIDLGVQTDERSAKLSGDRIMADDVLKEFLSRQEIKYDNVAKLYVTTPFRTAGDISNAYKCFVENKRKNMISCCEYEFPPQLSMTLNENDNFLEIDNSKFYEMTVSQTIKKKYHPNGAIFISKTSNFLEKGSFFTSSMTPYFMTHLKSIDIDHEYDLHFANFIIENGLDK